MPATSRLRGGRQKRETETVRRLDRLARPSAHGRSAVQLDDVDLIDTQNLRRGTELARGTLDRVEPRRRVQGQRIPAAPVLEPLRRGDPGRVEPLVEHARHRLAKAPPQRSGSRDVHVPQLHRRTAADRVGDFGDRVDVGHELLQLFARGLARDLDVVGDRFRNRWVAGELPRDRTRTWVSRMPLAPASRNRSLEMHPPIARYSSWPPLKPMPSPPASAGRSTTNVYGPALPIAAARPRALRNSTSKLTQTILT